MINLSLIFQLLVVSLSMENITQKEGSYYKIIGYSHKNKYYIKYYDAICICGKERKLTSQEVKRNISCGCVTNVDKNKTHGMSKTSEYKSWMSMKDRCLNSNSPSYHYYGGRGVKVSSEWINNFEQFYEDMGAKPNKSFTIERIDVNEGYCKENCIWATKKMQANNRRSNYLLTYKGITKTRSEWADTIGINVRTLASRCRANKSIEQILKEYETI